MQIRGIFQCRERPKVRVSHARYQTRLNCKSASSFRFRNNFLSCDVTGTDLKLSGCDETTDHRLQ